MRSTPFLLISYFITLIPFSTSLDSDGLSLLALKAAITSDPTRALATWSDSGSSPCHWAGVGCDPNNNARVTSISLSGKNLTGYIPSELGALLSLERLSLSKNNFSGPIPPSLFGANNLVYLDLSGNNLSGPIPDPISTLGSLTHLDLSSNSLNGSLPETLSNLTRLSGTLNLSCNYFSGEVPASYGLLPVRVSLDLRHNNLTGKIPQVGTLLNQGPTAFSGNPGLCGFPLQSECSDPDIQNPLWVLPDTEDPKDPSFASGSPGKAKMRNGSVTISVISGVSVVIGVVVVSMWVYRRKRRFLEGKLGKEKVDKDPGRVGGEGQNGNGKFVVIDEGFGLELEDLLRASAYVVGKSRSGIVYKVVVGRGSGAAGAVVAVRRLSEGDATWRLKEFESEVEGIGRVQHPNIVRLRAHYYANDEKLLVSEFIGNGSLHAALHGGPANSLQPLSWTARLKIAQGIARGLTHIHECSPRKYVHGNIKSSKVLLDNDLQPYISGFGLARLVSPNSLSRKQNSSQLTTSSKGSTSSILYVAPEARVLSNKFTPKCDVYSFGIVLLEILTGQTPDGGPNNDGKCLESLVRKVFREERPLSEIIDPALVQEVQAKKQVVGAFHIALSCTELDSELRPRMRSVCESLERIKLL